MNIARTALLSSIASAVLMFLTGCSASPNQEGRAEHSKQAQADEAKIATSLEKLPPEDRKLAESQRWCAVETENRLGGMGTPFKVVVNAQPVFLCCKGCRTRALANPEKTIAAVTTLRGKAGAELQAK